nr:immunoglobulin heavy chain junction region [Mus musculus]MBK4195492.1 immunoglobulin heavy chain junction region [Mus musculus]MBK4195493.1 immunoglobulin heavy chain junction region [Mus musculus]
CTRWDYYYGRSYDYW